REHARRPARRRAPGPARQRRHRDHVERGLRSLARLRPRHQRARAARPLSLRRPRRAGARPLRRHTARLARARGLGGGLTGRRGRRRRQRLMSELDRRSYAGKAPTPERHVPLVVVGAGAAGVAAAVEAARAGVEVLLLDEHPVDNDMMAMDVPLCFGQRMDATVRNRAAMLERIVETNPALATAHDAGVDVQLGTYDWGAFVNSATVQDLPAPMLGLSDD